MQRSGQPLAPDRKTFLTELTPLLGASLLSAVGSLSLHVAPIVTMVMIADSRTTIAGAGWIRSLAQLGEFAVALSLPLLGLVDIGRKAAFVTAVALLSGVVMATSQDSLLFLLGWFVIGASSGGLKYLGVMAAARSSRLTSAFSLRLAVVLLLAGSVSAFLTKAQLLAAYDALLGRLFILFAFGLLAGIVLYPGPPDAALSGQSGRASKTQNRHRPSMRELSGLAIVFLFFASISGVLIFALHQAVGRGLVTTDAVWVLAWTKIAAGVWLIFTSYVNARKNTQDRLLLLSFLVAGSTVAIYLSRDNVVLFASLLVWEIAVNNLSARLQAAVVRNAPNFAGQWLNFAILLGGITGPIANGFAISWGVDYGYVLFAVLAAFIPAVWLHWRNRTQGSQFGQDTGDTGSRHGPSASARQDVDGRDKARP